MRVRIRVLSLTIFVLVVSNLFLAGAMFGVHLAPRPAVSSQSPASGASAVFSQLGARGQAASTGMVDVSALPSALGRTGKLWSTLQSSPASQAGSISMLSPSTPSTNSSSLVAMSGGFDGLNMTQSCACFPPDPIIAAGPNHVFEMVNLEGQIFTKQGSSVKIFTLQSFYNSTSTHRLSDPKVLYDSVSGRWFTSIIEFWVEGFSLERSRVDFAISSTNDPTGTWTRYFVQPLFNTLPNPVSTITDQPTIGVSDDKFTISVNIFGDFGFAGNLFWILNKSEMLNAASRLDLASFGPYSQYESVHPVQSSSGTPAQYLASVGGGSLSATSNAVQLFSVTGVPPGNVSSQVISLHVSTIQEPPLAPQLGTQAHINPDDYRVQDAVWQNNILWLALNDGCTPTGDTVLRSCVHLIQVSTGSTSILQDFEYGKNGFYYFYPAIRMDGSGNLDLVYGSSSSTTYPSVAVTGQLITDPADSLAVAKTLKQGTSFDDTELLASRARYGDYFGASVDPVDSGNVWVVGEYIGDSHGLCIINCWSTFIGTTSMTGYGVTANPQSITVQAGSTATSIITVTSVNGFRGTVQLSTSVPPGGLSATLSASSVTLSAGGSATVTATVSNPSVTGIGKFVIAVTGTSGSNVRSAFITALTPNFSITANPAALSAQVGVSAASTITISAANGFQGTVNLSVTSSSSVSCALSPSSVTLGSTATSTVSCTGSAGGTYSATVTGSSGPYSHSVTLNVSEAPFSISANPTTVFLPEGSQGTSTITVTSLAGFSGTVNLSIDQAPLSNAVSISPTSVKLSSGGTNSSTLTFTAPTGVAAGTFTFTVRGTTFGLSNTVQVNLGLSDFTISASPTAIGLGANSPGTSTITVTSFNGLRGTVNLSTSIYPSTGLTCSLSLSSITLGPSGTSTLSCSASSGSYIVTVTGTIGSLSHSTSYITFGVDDFTISSQSNTVYATAGNSGSASIGLQGSSNGIGAWPVTLSISGLPAGASASFSPNPVTVNPNYQVFSTVTISTSTSTPLGSYTITVTGTYNGISHSITQTLQVIVASYTIPTTTQNFTNETVTYSGSLTVNTSPSLAVTGSMSYTATNTTTGAFIDSATVSMNLPISGTTATSAIEIPSSPYWTSVTCIFYVVQGTFSCSITRTPDIDHNGAIDSSDYSVVAAANNCSIGMSCYNPAADLLAQGTVTITDLGIEGAHQGGPLSLPADFALSSSPATISFMSGSSSSSMITASSLNGFTGTVNLSLSTPSGLSCNLNPTIINSTTSSTLNCSSSSPGVYAATISGSSGPMAHSATVNASVRQFSVSASPSGIQVPNSSTGTTTITLTGGPSFSGAVNLTSASSTTGLTGTLNPSSVNLTPGGTASATLTVAASGVSPGGYYMTVTATGGMTTTTATVQVTVTDFSISGLISTLVPEGSSFNGNPTVSPINGFTGTITFSYTILPNTLTCSFNPPSVTLGPATTVSIFCPATVGGSFTLTVTGTSGTLSHSVSTSIIVSDYTFTASPTSLTVQRLGFSSGTLTIHTSTLYQCCGATITATAPQGITVAYNDPSGGNELTNDFTGFIFGNQTYSLGESVLVDSSVQPGSYAVTFTAQAGGTAHTLSMTVVVSRFILSANPSAITFRHIASGSSTVTVTSINGYTGTIALSSAVGPAGLTCVLSPTSVTLGSSATATVTCQGSVGTYTVTVYGSNNSESHSVGITVTVTH